MGVEHCPPGLKLDVLRGSVSPSSCVKIKEPVTMGLMITCIPETLLWTTFQKR